MEDKKIKEITDFAFTISLIIMAVNLSFAFTFLLIVKEYLLGLPFLANIFLTLYLAQIISQIDSEKKESDNL